MLVPAAPEAALIAPPLSFHSRTRLAPHSASSTPASAATQLCSLFPAIGPPINSFLSPPQPVPQFPALQPQSAGLPPAADQRKNALSILPTWPITSHFALQVIHSWAKWRWPDNVAGDQKAQFWVGCHPLICAGRAASRHDMLSSNAHPTYPLPAAIFSNCADHHHH